MTMHLGIVGLGTMGANLARNAARNGATVAVYNRTPQKTDAFAAEYGKEGTFIPCKTYAELARALPSPRSILLMVKAGPDTDAVIEDLLPHLENGDCIIDAGNSHYRDTERREKFLREQGIAFIGMGVSGGEEGALKGPSMMPGGDRAAVERLMSLFSAMAAEDGDGGTCIAYMGSGGAGHFVKMVHNGIEYGIMQLIAETYDVLKHVGGFSNEQLAETFAAWDKQPGLSSFLIEITADIFTKKDTETGADLIDMIKDGAGQKGTGKWTTEAAMTLGEATPTIDAAVTARILSSSPRRIARNRSKFPAELVQQDIPASATVQEWMAAALECSFICTYNQGFHLIERASETLGWNVSLAEVARIWRGGCIIRSSLLPTYQRACNPNETEAALVVEQEIIGRFADGRQEQWRSLVCLAQSQGIPIPALAATLSYYDTIRSDHLPQNLIQAQRDYFGAHGFERMDREGVFHGAWK